LSDEEYLVNSIVQTSFFTVAEDSASTSVRLFIPMDIKDDWLIKTAFYYFTSMKTVTTDID
jgi:hypothetical protein